jgi:uncharacterized membrane protein
MPDAGRAAMVAVGAGLAAIVAARSARTLRAAPLALVGAGLLYRGLRRGARRGDRVAMTHLLEAERSITVRGPVAELYEMWRKPEVLSAILDGMGELRPDDGGHVRWILRLPGGRFVGFRAELIEQTPYTLVWRTAAAPEQGDVPAKGHDAAVVQFHPAPADKGTVVTLRLRIEPPGGRLGEAILQSLHRGIDFVVDGALRRFENLAEAGEIPTLAHNPSGRARRSEWESAPDRTEENRAV